MKSRMKSFASIVYSNFCTFLFVCSSSSNFCLGEVVQHFEVMTIGHGGPYLKDLWHPFIRLAKDQPYQL